MSNAGGAFAAVIVAGALATSGCYGGISALPGDDGPGAASGVAEDDSGSGPGSSDGSDDGGPSATQPLPSAARRLSRVEIGQVLRDVLDLELDEVANLPDDARTPFDNDYTTQAASLALAQGMYELSLAAGDAVSSNPAVLHSRVGCVVGSDPDCLGTATETIARQLLRRPVSNDELTELLELRAAANGDDVEALGLIVSTLLLDPEFLYRIERGDEENGAIHLDNSSIASRLSFLLWGSVPDDRLIDGTADLRDDRVREDEARRMLADPRAVRQVQRLHAMWLGYDELLAADPSLTDALRQETDALIERVVFEEGLPWTELLVFEETWVTPELAAHYGLPPIDEPGWVSYQDERRGGLLSHGSYLSTGVNFGITSPTQRGKNVLELLLCRELPAVPAEVMVDEPPGTDSPDACKEDIWSMAQIDSCKGCHQMIDTVGFGLEQFGSMGEFRTTEEDRPSCTARSQGTLAELGEFSGPGELGRLLADQAEARGCFTEKFLQFALGRADVEDAEELEAHLAGRFEQQTTVQELIVAIVSDESFAWRKI